MRVARLQVLFVLLLFANTASATSSLWFGGEGYDISMEIGHDVAPVVASLKVYTPLAPNGVFLYGNFQTVAFDTKKRTLLIQFTQKDGTKEPGSFTLTVKGSAATLHIDNKVIRSTFSWEM